MEDTREIYSIQDCISILEDVLPDQLGLGYEVTKTICQKVEQNFKYVNWDRFKSANCPGCVSGPDDCDIAYGRGEYYGTWEKIVNGKIQSCPRRVNGTMVFNTDEAEKGIQEINISDHKFNVVEVFKY